MTAKRVIVFLLAACLTVGAVLMMFPNWMHKLFPDVNFDEKYVDFDALSIYNFPFYGSARQQPLPLSEQPWDALPAQDAPATYKYGISNIVAEYMKYLTKQTAEKPDLGTQLDMIIKQEGFAQTLYSLLMVSLITIPVYMVLRLLIYNTLYDMTKRVLWIFKLAWSGLVAVSASVVTTFATWFLYRAFLYELTFNIIFDWLKSVVNEALALYSLGSAMTLLVGFLVVWLIRATVFRGSVFGSIVGALMRTLLFTILIAIISVFIFEKTLFTLIFILAGLMVIGLIKTVFLPEKSR